MRLLGARAKIVAAPPPPAPIGRTRGRSAALAPSATTAGLLDTPLGADGLGPSLTVMLADVATPTASLLRSATTQLERVKTESLWAEVAQALENEGMPVPTQSSTDTEPVPAPEPLSRVPSSNLDQLAGVALAQAPPKRRRRG
ncbi:MAG: hypothetical protein P4L40_05395 [Terracidiphilus sp.]|nr:hypothetical protein [Terracidiphilus sp.]